MTRMLAAVLLVASVVSAMSEVGGKEFISLLNGKVPVPRRKPRSASHLLGAEDDGRDRQWLVLMQGPLTPDVRGVACPARSNFALSLEQRVSDVCQYVGGNTFIRILSPARAHKLLTSEHVRHVALMTSVLRVDRQLWAEAASANESNAVPKGGGLGMGGQTELDEISASTFVSGRTLTVRPPTGTDLPPRTC